MQAPSAHQGPLGGTPQAELASRLFLPAEFIEIDPHEPELGRGGFAVVRRGKYRPNGRGHPKDVAVKIYIGSEASRTMKQLREEIIKFLDVVLHCTHVAKLYGCTQFGEGHACGVAGSAIVMHLYPMDLRRYMQRYAPHPPPLATILLPRVTRSFFFRLRLG